MANQYPTGGVTLGAFSEVADYSAADHVFTGPTTKGLIVVAPTGGGILQCRLRDDAVDRAMPVPEGQSFQPYQVAIVRMTGTTATQVIGLLA